MCKSFLSTADHCTFVLCCNLRAYLFYLKDQYLITAPPQPAPGSRKAVFIMAEYHLKLLYVELGGMTKNLYHGIFLNYTGFTVYDGIYFFHA